MKFILLIAATFVMASFAAKSAAFDSSDDDRVVVGEWNISLGLGIGTRTNPVEGGDNFPLLLIPQVNYNGERFFIQNLDFGWILVESETQQLNLLATPSYDQVFFDRWNPTNFLTETQRVVTAGTDQHVGKGDLVPTIETDTELVSPGSSDVGQRRLRERRTAGLAGFEYQIFLKSFSLNLQYLKEFTGLHHGEEARVYLAKRWFSGRHEFTGSLGGAWQGSEGINYYYGVLPQEADARGTYSAGDGVATLARFDWNYELSKRWDLRMFASLRRLPGEMSRSPLVNDNEVISVFVGGVYHF